MYIIYPLLIGSFFSPRQIKEPSIHLFIEPVESEASFGARLGPPLPKGGIGIGFAIE